MGVGAGLSMYVVVVQKFTFAISSPDEFLSYRGAAYGLRVQPSPRNIGGSTEHGHWQTRVCMGALSKFIWCD